MREWRNFANSPGFANKAAKLGHLVGHQEERAHFETGILWAEAVGIVLLLDVDELLRGSDGFERNVVVVAILEDDEAAADFFQEQVESEIAVSHRRDGINGVGVAATDEIAEFLGDDVDFLALVKFGGDISHFFGNDIADATELFVAEGVGSFTLEHHFATFEHRAF